MGSVFVDKEKANKSIRKTDSLGEKLGGTFKKSIATVGKWGKVAAKAGLAVGAGFAAIGVIAAKNLEAQERAETRLESIAKTVSGATDAQIKSLKALASATQEYTTFGDDVIMSGQSQLLSYGATTEQTGELTESMANLLAATKGVDATQDDAIGAANMLGKAFSGQVGALSEAGILLDENQALILQTGDATERTAVLTEILNQNYGGLAEGLAKTSEGMRKQMMNTLGDISERLAGKFMPIVVNATQYIMDHMPQIEIFVDKAFTVFGNVVTWVVEVFQTKFLPVIMFVFNWIKDNMPKIQENAGTAFEKIKERITELVTEIKDFFLPILERLWVAFRDNILPILQDLFAWVQDHMPQIKTIFETVWDAVKVAVDVVVTVIETLFNMISGLYDFVKGPFAFIGELVIGAFGGAVEFISGFIDTIKSAVDWLSKYIDKINTFNRTNLKQTQTNFGSGFNSSSAITGSSPSATSSSSFYSPYGSPVINITGNNIMSDDDPVIDAIGTAVVNNLRLAGVN